MAAIACNEIYQMVKFTDTEAQRWALYFLYINCRWLWSTHLNCSSEKGNVTPPGPDSPPLGADSPPPGADRPPPGADRPPPGRVNELDIL